MTIESVQVDAIVIGGGFGGCTALYRLRKLGLTTKLMEAGSDFGGVWHWNRYPGARVDGEWLMYQLSFPEVWKDWRWSERFPSGDELRAYFQHVDQTLELRKDTFFNTTVTKCRYNRQSGLWTIHTAQGWCAMCRYLIAATGASYKQYIPQYPGMERYQGVVVHPAAYPDDLNVRGKKVGIVGNGASGVQLVQELAKDASELVTFIRTPCIAVPMRQRAIPAAEAEAVKIVYDAIFDRCRRTAAGCAFNSPQGSCLQATEAQRKALFDELWFRGGWEILVSGYNDHTVDGTANSIIYQYWAERVRARMTDRKKMDVVAPLQQEQWWGVKRPCLEQDYYEMIDRENVMVHNLKEAPIVGLDEHGIVTSSGKHYDLDVIIFATGYDALTGSLLDLGLENDEQTLQDIWQHGTRTYLGLMIPGMPNLFTIYGPQAPTSLTCGPQFIEMEIDLVCQAISRMKETGLTRLEASPEAAEKWAEDVRSLSKATLFSGADTWYSGANIPGKRREPLVYMGGVVEWWKKCSAALDTWDGFQTA